MFLKNSRVCEGEVNRMLMPAGCGMLTTLINVFWKDRVNMILTALVIIYCMRATKRPSEL